MDLGYAPATADVAEVEVAGEVVAAAGASRPVTHDRRPGAGTRGLLRRSAAAAAAKLRPLLQIGSARVGDSLLVRSSDLFVPEYGLGWAVGLCSQGGAGQ